MTDPTPPKPTVAGVPPWLAAVLTIVATLPQLLHAVNVQPTPGPVKPPAPVVTPVITPPIVTPVTPPPVVTPVVTPPPPTLIPTATITTTDAQGRPITGPVEPGAQFIVSSKGSVHADGAIRWTVEPSDPEAARPIPFPDGTGYVGTLQPGASIVFVLSTAAGNLVETAKTRVICKTAPQPPPVPVVVNPPAPTPTPKPTPQPGALRVLIAFESSQAHTREQLAVLNSTALRAALDAKCTPDAGLASWRQWDKDVDTTKDPSASLRDLWKQALPTAKADGLPALIVARGTDVTVYPLPSTEAEAVALVNGSK